MKNAIITGATSFLGSALTELLLQNHVEIWAVVRPHSQNIGRLPKAHQLHIIELDMADITRLSSMRLPPINAFYHLAWDGIRAPARDNTAIQKCNYIASIDAVKTAATLGCQAFIGAGSQAEYGLLSGMIDENSPTQPLTAYGKEKLNVYSDGQQLADHQGMRFIWPRIFSLYGTLDYKNTLVMSCLEKMQQNVSINLTACTQLWDYLHVMDAANAYYLLGLSKKAKGVYPVASGQARPLKEYVEEIKQIIHSSSLLNFGAIPYPPEGAASFEPVVNRLKKELNWTPKISFHEGIKDILCHMERPGHNENN